MPVKTRDLAQESLLLLVAASLLCLGAAGVALHLWERHDALVANVLVPDAALSAMLFGTGLLASLQGWRWLRCSAMVTLILLLLYTLAHNAMAGGVSASWITPGRRMATILTLTMLPAAVSLLCGLTRLWHQRLWRLSGVLLLVFGVLAFGVLSGVWFQGVLGTQGVLATSSPLVVVFFAFLLGVALLLASQRESNKALNPGALTVAACVGGVALSSLAWLVLSQQQHDNLVPTGVAFGGLTLSWLLAFSLGAVSLTSARSQELTQARQALEDQQRTQRMIAQDAPLDRILETICQMLERQLPGAICSIMLANTEKTSLYLAAGERLPAPYRKAITRIRIGINSGACGSAAFLQEPVICADIANDARWKGYKDTALKNGLSACWSCPVIGGDGQILGTFATYYRRVAEPDKTHQVFIEKAAGLVALAVERAQARRSLQESEQRYRSLLVHHPDAVFSLDLDGRFISANATCGTITGYTPDEMLGRSFVDFIQREDIERLLQHFNAAKQGHIERYEFVLHDRDGKAHVIAMINTPIIVNDEIEGVYGIGQDVTASRGQQTQLRTLERCVEASVNGIVIADARQPDQPIVYANSAFCHMTGYDQHEIIGRNCRFLQGEGSDPKVVSRIQAHVNAQRDIHVTLCNYRKDGTLFWNDLYIAPVRDDAGHVTHFVGVQHDITEHKAFEARLAYHASHDSLTHLPNRSLFEERLIAEFNDSQRRGKQVAVLFVDLDDFKPINDNLGHAVGDKLLIDVAQRLLAAVRPQDTVARLGGDEFVILQPNIDDGTHVMGVVERMLPALAQSYCIEGQELYLTASIGIAMSQPDTLHPQELLQQADMAMYQAKQQGRNAYHWFNHTLTDSVSERMVLRNDLQEAIDNEGFELYYQPLINRDGRLSGVEALLRWPHPQKGFISPARFIPLAEATGQIMPISEWVLMRACRDMQALADQGYGAVKAAVNVSPLQFHRASFLATLRATLDATGLPAEQLELELTEGVLLDNTEAAIDTLHALRSMHIPVAIDDFGTGFSSLSYLKNLPISTVKIDRSFIKELPHSEDDAAIVQGIISMAHHLGLNVVAEGVETPPQHVRLLDYQCDIFQGFGLAKPMPLDKLKSFLQDLEHTPITPNTTPDTKVSSS
ncbi:EAL domain-containing protein [Halomonas vilamensis]|uniref:EAL domain-containing protein n=1 Tax=Vreelandella vilamensis TaxID=531309 RepID=A0ABU1GZB3_9GAMM|nr:EAL domain-containing protein [Halomonas vilamensis]MDR5897395.1 EAL domain-containing protein [Halomonas vilamensis]